MLFFAGASTYRTTSLTTELTCRCHLCTTPFCSLQRAFILGFNLSWSFDGDFYFCFVGWVVLGFWVLGVFFVCFLTYLSYQRGQKGGEKKFQAAKFTLLSRFGFFFENTDKGRRAMVTPVRYYPSTKIAVIKTDMQSVLASYYSCTNY